jgi:ribonuclease BN (tRNA processing enzyme)
MKLTILGSGTSVPHPRRSSPGFWIETADRKILLDVSADVPHRLAVEGIDWPAVDLIWLSHFHLDHMAGLFPFLFSFRWSPQTQSRVKPLRIVGGPGLRHRFEVFNQSGRYRLDEQKFPLELEEISPGQGFIAGANLLATTLSTPHTEESMALRLLDSNKKSFVYTSDTGFSEELITFAHAADLLLLECSFRRNKTVAKHLEFSEAMLLARMIEPQRLVLTHLYPEWDRIDLAAEAKQYWSGVTIEAVDGLTLTI